MTWNAERLPRLYSVPEIVKMSGASESTVRRWIRSGALRSLKIGHLRRILPADFLACVGRHAAAWDDLRDCAARDHQAG